MEIKVLKNVMIKNSAIGKDNKELFASKGVFTINMVSSPGAGKTTLLESLIEVMGTRCKIGVIEGDLYTSMDAARLERFNIPIVQINTEGGCHLDARMVSGAVKEMGIDGLDLLVIENVGNLVCPASFDLGEQLRILVYSVTEGADKPRKYETMFKTANAVIINKVDLADVCKIDINAVEKDIKDLNPRAKIFKTTANKKDTLNDFVLWLTGEIKSAKKIKD
jgi:hydrogenase nickel incorporation protein HypB